MIGSRNGLRLRWLLLLLLAYGHSGAWYLYELGRYGHGWRRCGRIRTRLVVLIIVVTVVVVVAAVVAVVVVVVVVALCGDDVLICVVVWTVAVVVVVFIGGFGLLGLEQTHCWSENSRLLVLSCLVLCCCLLRKK